MLDVDSICKVKAITMRTESDIILYKTYHHNFMFEMHWCIGTSYSVRIYDSNFESELSYFEHSHISTVKEFARDFILKQEELSS